jgi:hypothetical protein
VIGEFQQIRNAHFARFQIAVQPCSLSEYSLFLSAARALTAGRNHLTTTNLSATVPPK